MADLTLQIKVIFKKIKKLFIGFIGKISEFFG